ncbi:MAG: nucleotidyltransferase domain-containing protein [Cellulosilyticaceae bacterium]
MYRFPVVVECKYDLSGIYPPMQPYVKKLIECIPEYIEKLIIFGSSVTLRYGEDSDLDVMVITNRGQEEVLLEISKCLRGIGVSVDLLIKSKEAFEKESIENPNGICGEVYKKGVCVYERAIRTC